MPIPVQEKLYGDVHKHIPSEVSMSENDWKKEEEEEALWFKKVK